MEINKLTFENLRNLNISQSFDELDINTDGIINEKDLNVSTDTTTYTAINKLLNSVDDEAELVKEPKTLATKTPNGILNTDAASFEQDVKNSKGTVYVVMGNLSGCGPCKKLDSVLGKNLTELEKVANIYNMDWNENGDLCRQIFKDGGGTGSAKFPQVAKFVDGKLVGLLDNPRDQVTTVQEMITKAEGVPSKKTADTEAVETIDTSKLSEEDKAKLEELKAELKTLNADIERLNNEINALVTENKELEEEKARLEEEQKEAQIEANDKNAKLATEQKKLEMYSREYDDYQMKLDQLNSEILLEQGRAEEEFNDSMSNLVNKAVNEYDPKEHGDNFNAYFERKMSEQGYPTFAVLDNLNFQAKNISNNASAVLFNIRSQSAIVSSAKSAVDNANAALTSVTDSLNSVINEINSNNSQIESLQGTLATKRTRKAEVTQEIAKIRPVEEGKDLLASEILEKISEKEKCFAKELGWDLKECFIALGADNNFHIYNPKSLFAGGLVLSSTRAYFQKTTGNVYGGDSFSITPNGSGMIGPILNEKEPSESNGKPIYRFSCVNEDWTDGEVKETSGCYCTVSPLSFDVNGDGIQTKENTINYDIDGDGKIDIVNDSADWVLAFDKDKDGIAGSNGSELFGNNTDRDGDGVKDGYKDGFAALKALAQKEGLIDNKDRNLDEADLTLLSEKYGLTMKNGYLGETKSLADLGITEINLSKTNSTKMLSNFDGRNNDLMTQEGATFIVNGQTQDYADIWNAKKISVEPAVLEEIKATEKLNLVKANIKETKVELKLNKDNILALKGDIDVQSIKNNAMNKAEAPKNIFEEIIEIKEDEEEV